MKIAVLGTRGFPNVPGGVETHCENLYPCLAKKYCDVTVFTRRPYVDAACNNYKGVKLVPLPCLKNKYLEAFLHTLFGVFAARIASPDILHIHGIGPSLVVPIARLLGLKVVMTHHGQDYERKKWGGFAKFFLSLGEYLGSKYSNAVICISAAIAGKVGYRKDMAVIPNGAVVARVLEDDTLIRKYGLSKKRYILSVGRVVPEKRFHDLIEAFQDIKGCKLVIAGDADHLDRYSIDLMKRQEKNSDIVFTGFLTGDELRQLYSHAGLFVLPSSYEGMPIVLLEAMSFGLSCIASDIPANRNIGMEENRFFKAGDIQALANKIKEFIDKPLTDEEKSRQIERVTKVYNWENIADMTLDIYQQVERKIVDD